MSEWWEGIGEVENGNNKMDLVSALGYTIPINYWQCMSPVPKTINNLPWHLFSLCIIKRFLTQYFKKHGGRGCGEIVVEYIKKKSVLLIYVTSVSSLQFQIHSRFRTSFVHPRRALFRFISDSYWRSIDFRTLSPKTTANTEDVVVFCFA